MSEDLLRQLAEARPERGRVLTLYLDLDPTEFATADARSSAVTSLIDAAEREVEAAEGLDHDELRELREDVERAREFFEGIVPADAPYADGARSIALFACGTAGLFRPLRLEHPVPTGARVADRPWIHPLTEAARPDWCVLLANRRVARVFLGGPDRLRELGSLEDHVHGRHDQGGWSQARYQRSVDKDTEDHLAHVGEVLRRELADRPFTRMLIGAPEEMQPNVEEHLPSELRRRIVGRIRVDVENAGADELLEAAAPAFEEAERRRVDERVDRLRKGAAHGTGALGLEDVLAALNERAVETLLLQRGLRAPGKECPHCGLLAPADAPPSCPADGTPLQQRNDVIEPALRLAVAQSAEILHLSDDRDELRPVGEIGAVLRFAVRTDVD